MKSVKIMKICKAYLDNSALNRPFDDQSVPNIRMEAIAVLSIFELIDKKRIKLINSDVIEYENSKNPFFERKIWISANLSRTDLNQKINTKIKSRAEEIEELGIAGIDSLHLSSAELAKVSYFITCDYGIIKKYKGKIKVANPVDFIKSFK